MVNLYDLKPGDRVRTVDGAGAEILVPTEDGQWIRVRYMAAVDSSLVGTVDLAHEGELAARTPSHTVTLDGSGEN